MCVCVCVCHGHVAADQCRSNHPTGAVWSPITLFKQTAQPDRQTLWWLTDYWIALQPVHHHSVRLHAHNNQIIVNNRIKVTVRFKHSRGLGWPDSPSYPSSHDLLINRVNVSIEGWVVACVTHLIIPQLLASLQVDNNDVSWNLSRIKLLNVTVIQLPGYIYSIVGFNSTKTTHMTSAVQYSASPYCYYLA